MRKSILFGLITFLTIVSCKNKLNNTNSNYQLDSLNYVIKLPIGNLDAIGYEFPKKWGNMGLEEIDTFTTSKYTEIQKLLDFNYIFFKSLQENSNYIKTLPIKYFENKKITFKEQDPFFKTDSISYFNGLIYQNKKIKVAFFKDRGLYNSFKGDEGCVINYINLVVINEQNKVKDYLTVSITTNCLYNSLQRFFYIDKDLNVVIKDFRFDEIESIYLGQEKYKFNDKGVFVKVN